MRREEANTARTIDLGEFTVQILKTTLGHAAKTYKRITWMNYLMFVTGLGVFITAAVYGAVGDEKVYAAIFGGLGAATFIALFLTGPIEKTQTALSNLVQVEVGFMDYFEQITLWEAYALRPEGNPPMPSSENIQRASESLQQRTAETMELLQKFLEPQADSG